MRIKVEAFRAKLAECLGCARTEPVVVLRHGEPVAAVISIHDLEELQRLRGLYRTVHFLKPRELAFTRAQTTGQPERPQPKALTKP